MIYALFTILIVVGIAYRNDVRIGQLNKPFFHRYKKLLILTGIAVIPIVTLNILRPNGHSFTPSEVLEDALKTGTNTEILEAYTLNIVAYPDSVPIYLGYIETYTQTTYGHCYHIDFSRFTSDREVLTICSEYHASFCNELEGEPNFQPIHDFDMISTPYINYVRGKKALMDYQFDQAERYLKQEIKINPDFADSYMALYKLYSRYRLDKLDAFILDPVYAKHLPNRLLNYEYFRMGSYGNYLYTIFTERYLGIQFMAFFAGLIISIVWLIYLRSMDVYNKERWLDIILVFIGGVFLTHYCLPLYDYAHYVLHLGINGEFWNDFFYCSFVIGGSEETVKLIPWVVFALFAKKMKEPYDYILYASVSALGFAFAENWMYLEHSQNIASRFVMSTVAHMFFASIVAYSIVLAKYKFKQKLWKLITPILGFFIACLAHGFYDFWLISPSTRGLSIVTTVFFILSIHVWFYLKNNSINNSRFYNSTPFNVSYQLNLFMFAVVGILMLEYIFMSIDYGATWANHALRGDAWMLCAFLIYMTSILKKFQPVQGAWMKYKLPQLPRFIRAAFALPEQQNTGDDERSLVGQKLRMFSPKTNPYIGKLLPVNGKCISKITVSENPDWYLVELKRPLDFPQHHQTQVIVKSKSIEKTLEDDKIEIYFMLIPDGLSLEQTGLSVEDLHYTGRAYSRPV